MRAAGSRLSWDSGCVWHDPTEEARRVRGERLRLLAAPSTASTPLPVPSAVPLVLPLVVMALLVQPGCPWVKAYVP